MFLRRPPRAPVFVPVDPAWDPRSQGGQGDDRVDIGRGKVEGDPRDPACSRLCRQPRVDCGARGVGGGGGEVGAVELRQSHSPPRSPPNCSVNPRCCIDLAHPILVPMGRYYEGSCPTNHPPGPSSPPAPRSSGVGPRAAREQGSIMTRFHRTVRYGAARSGTAWLR